MILLQAGHRLGISSRNDAKPVPSDNLPHPAPRREPNPGTPPEPKKHREHDDEEE